jgi:hypothetical protein
LFRRRIGVVVVAAVEADIGECAKKNYFHTRNNFLFSMTTRVRSRLAYQENAPFPIYFLFVEIAQGVGKITYIDIKEYQPRNKQYKTEIILCKNSKSVYLGFIPPDLT